MVNYRQPHKMVGFTLIELMITVAIVGILGAVALPAYQDYVIRSQVSEGFQLANGIKTAAVENYAQNGVFAVDNAALNYSGSISGKYVSLITSTGSGDQEVLKVIYSSSSPQQSNSKINGGYVTFTGTVDSSGITQWTCAPDGTIIVKKYMPTSCDGDTGSGTGSGSSGSSGTGSSSSSGSGSSGNSGTSTPSGNGDITNADGSVTHADGSVTNADGTITLTAAQISQFPSIASAISSYNNSLQRYNNDVTNIASNQTALATAQASLSQYQSQLAAISDQNAKNNIINSSAYQSVVQAVNQTNSNLTQYNNDLGNAVTEIQNNITNYNNQVSDYKRNVSATLPADFPAAPTVPSAKT